jgi:general secretion pathway protein L
VLRKTLVLPLAVEENLRQAIGYDLDRHTPFKPEELYFDAVVTSRDAARNLVHVELVTALRSVVDPLVRHAESFGAVVAVVSPVDPRVAAASPLNLLPPEQRRVRTLWRSWQFWLPVALLAAVVVVATMLPLWQKRAYAIALGELADQARAEAAISETLRTALERQTGDYNFALERKFAFAPTVQTLDDVSRLLPDDTWLTQFELRMARGKELQRELNLRGESANAGRLVGVLEESGLFTQAAPRSPTTKIQPGPGEIFDVGAQLKPLRAPAPAPLVVAAGARSAAAATPSKAPASPPATPGAATATSRAPATPAATPATPAAKPAAPAATPTPPATAPTTPATAPATPAAAPATPGATPAAPAATPAPPATAPAPPATAPAPAAATPAAPTAAPASPGSGASAQPTSPSPKRAATATSGSPAKPAEAPSSTAAGATPRAAGEPAGGRP